MLFFTLTAALICAGLVHQTVLATDNTTGNTAQSDDIRAAFAALKSGKFTEALDLLKKMQAAGVNDPNIFIGLGECSFNLSDYPEAETWFLKAVECYPDTHPDTVIAHRRLGDIYYLQNEPALAAAHWEKALALNPADQALAARVGRLKKQMAHAQDFEVEADYMFSVTFDGDKIPELRYTVMDMLQKAHYRIIRDLDLWPSRQIAVTLLTKDAFFDITGSPSWAGGVYEGQIKIPVAGYKPDQLRVVLNHEYIHAVIYDLMAGRCPWWFNEGLAQYFSNDEAFNPLKLDRACRILTRIGEAEKRVSLNALPGLGNKGSSQSPEQVLDAYALALSATDFLITFFGIPSLQTILFHMGAGSDFNTALSDVTGYSLQEFESEWTTMLRCASR